MTDWKKLHADNVAKLDPTLRDQAVNLLRKELTECMPDLREAIDRDPQEWWVGHHFSWMMAIRNFLRQNNCGEKEFGIDNLDDYAVGLVELAAK